MCGLKAVKPTYMEAQHEIGDLLEEANKNWKALKQVTPW